jgi:sugar/nucleoside kinase (ribokinase family)
VSLDLLTLGETLVEVMRTETNQPLDQTALFTGPYASGAPFIFAMQAARLGAKVGGVGAVGEDAFGDFLLRQFAADGIETSGIRKVAGYATGVAFVAYRDDGSRDFVFHIKQAAAGQLSPDMLDERWFVGLKCLHLMGSTLSIHDAALRTGYQAVQWAKKHGAKVSFDPNLRPQLMPVEQARKKFGLIMAHADVLMPTADELQWLTYATNLQDAVASWLQKKRVIVVTQGAKGCTVYTNDHPDGVHVAGFAVQEVDPTGAGDCFDAGFLVKWLEGASPIEAARFANACGALAVTKQGPAEGAMRRDVVEKFVAGQTSP